MGRAAIAAILASTMLSGTAHAMVIGGTITGRIDGNVFDTYGLFGAPGGNLAGLTLTASYRYDTALASYSMQSGTDAWVGTGDLTLSVTVGGVTVAPLGAMESEVAATMDGAETQLTLANFAPTPLLDFVLLASGAWQPGVTIDAPFALDPEDYQQTIYVSADGSHYDTLYFAGSAEGGTEVGWTEVPEPASATLLGAALLALWRRR